MHNIKFHLVFINDFLEHNDKNVLIICTLKSRPWTNNKLNGAQIALKKEWNSNQAIERDI